MKKFLQFIFYTNLFFPCLLLAWILKTYRDFQLEPDNDLIVFLFFSTWFVYLFDRLYLGKKVDFYNVKNRYIFQKKYFILLQFLLIVNLFLSFFFFSI